MVVDENARLKLQNLQTARTITDGLDKVVDAIKETSVVAKPQPKTPANELADELRNLQRAIGGGNLTEALSKLSGSLEGFDVDKNALGQLKSLIVDLSAKLKLLADLEVRIPKDIDLNFPEDVQVVGKVDIGTIDELPPVNISNIADLAKALSGVLNNLQVATIKAIERTKPEFPKGMTIINKVKIEEFQTLLDDMEELKKGFNTLINKEVGAVTFPTQTIPVEITNQFIPQPVTNINVNALQGLVLSTAMTATGTAAALPTTPIANRRSLMIFNNDSTLTVFIGGVGLTASNGLPVLAQTYSPSIDAGKNMILYVITSGGSVNIRVLEASHESSGR